MFYLNLILAGGMGTLLRYLLSRLTVNLGLTALPFGTLAANLLGSFLIGYLSWVLVNKWHLGKEMQIIILTGFLGGFTTFSAFSLETVTLYEQGFNLRAIAYAMASVVLSIVMCWLGLILARQS